MDHERRRGLVFPILLITAGFLLLLNTLGVLDWSLWRLLVNLWPIILIAIGLDAIIGRRSTIGSLAVGLITLALIFGSVWYLSAGSGISLGAPSSVTSHTINQPLDGATRARFEIKAGAGALQLNPLPESDQLVAGVVRLRSDRELEQSFNLDGDTADYRLAAPGATVLVPMLPGDKAETWDLQLNQAVPTDLTVVTGVGESTLHLERMNLTGLGVKVGVGTTTVNLPQRGRYDADIKGGIGALRLRIAKGMAARIQANSGIGDVRVSDDFEHQGDVYISPDYGTASNRVDITISTGIGQVTVETYRGE